MGYARQVEEQPSVIPIFPLPNVALFPGVVTPLHVFEPRYRQMTEDALAGDRRIAMAAVLPDRVDEMAGDPPVFPIACAGVIRDSRRLEDGRFLMVLLGTVRVRILREPPRPPGRLYRTAVVEELEDLFEPAEAGRVAGLRRRAGELARRFAAASPASLQDFDPDATAGIDDTTWVNALCNGLLLPVREKQALLQADTVPARFERLVEVLEFFLAAGAPRKGPNPGRFH
jgi:Lon protease-like protein